jgi:hypothetical protein
MTAVVIAIDLLISICCWLIAWQLIRMQPQIVALVEILDTANLSVARLGLLPTLLADRQQSIRQLHQLYQLPVNVIDRLWQLVRLLLWVRTRL